MGTTSTIKILESPNLIFPQLAVRLRLVNLTMEIFTPIFQERDENDQPKYSNCFFRYHGVDGYSIKFMVWIAGDRTILKNFVVEKSVEIEKKKWYQFWKNDTLPKIIESMLISENHTKEIVLNSFTDNVIKNLLNVCEKV